MEWLDRGQYTLEWVHPPLGRIFSALGPYINGLRYEHGETPYAAGVKILAAEGNFDFNLALARAGNLPFFVLAVVVVFLWGRRWFSAGAALWAAALFVALPPVLGHSGLATLDMSAAATCGLGLYVLLRWLERPGWKEAAWLGVALGLTCLGKFNSVMFFAASLALCGSWWLWLHRGEWQASLRLRQLVLSAGLMLIIVWAAYRFSLVPLEALDVEYKGGAHPSIDRRLSDYPMLRDLAYRLVAIPLPLQQVAGGLMQAASHNRHGHFTYLLGETGFMGWWYFFPVVLAVKTPLAFLVPSLAALFYCLKRMSKDHWAKGATALFVIAILGFSMTARINLGVRHLLAIYIPLAVLAGYGFEMLLRKPFGKPVVALLAFGSLFSWATAWPDNLAYFNLIAANHPERVLAESDLDWGQDLYRLRDRLRELGAEEVAIGYYGNYPLAMAGLPPYRILSPSEPAQGYVAISLRLIVMENKEFGRYQWLKAHKPIERIGKSIDLYRIDP